VIVDLELNLLVWVSDSSQKVQKRTCTYALGKRLQ